MKTILTALLATALTLGTAGYAAADKGGNGNGNGGGSSSDHGGGNGGGDHGGAHAESNGNRGSGGDNRGQARSAEVRAAHAARDAGGVKAETFGSLISGIDSGKLTSDDLGDVTDDEVTVVSVEGTLKGSRAAALENALAHNGAAVDDLQAAIEADATLSAALADLGVSVEDVIGVSVKGDRVTVYTYGG